MACFVYYYLICICYFLLETNETGFTSLPKNIQGGMRSTLGSTRLAINYSLWKVETYKVATVIWIYI
jgi:hypothetical protein